MTQWSDFTWLFFASIRVSTGAAFAAEMTHVFGQAAAEQRKRGKAFWLVFAAREFAALARGVVSEHIAKWQARDAYVTARCQPRIPTDAGDEIADMQRRLKELVRSMEYAIAHHDFPGARSLCEQERLTRLRLSELSASPQE